MTDDITTYGLEVESVLREQRELIGRVQRTNSGNVALSIGRENVPGLPGVLGWTKIGHVVMTRDEARTFARSVLEMTD